MAAQMDGIIRALERILVDRDFSMSSAHALEAEVASRSEDSRLEDLADVLASYRPGGGDYLYDETKLESECRFVYHLLTDQ